MIQAIITDFDGTLVDTFNANFNAYKRAFEAVGETLSENLYRRAFGLRYDDFMAMMKISDERIKEEIRERKKQYYPDYFHLLKSNHSLIAFLSSFHQQGGKTAIASTARRENLENVLCYLQLKEIFDAIYAGMNVKYGKPHPDIYLKVMELLDVKPEETLIFEDSDVGIQAAMASGANYIRVLPKFFK